jgi:hypothetical protein
MLDIGETNWIWLGLHLLFVVGLITVAALYNYQTLRAGAALRWIEWLAFNTALLWASGLLVWRVLCHTMLRVTEQGVSRNCLWRHAAILWNDVTAVSVRGDTIGLEASMEVIRIKADFFSDRERIQRTLYQRVPESARGRKLLLDTIEE